MNFLAFYPISWVLLIFLVVPNQASDGINLRYSYTRDPLRRSIGNIVPKPKDIKFIQGNNYVLVNASNFQIQSVNLDCPIVEQAIERYMSPNGSMIFDDLRPRERDELVPFKSRKRIGILNKVLLTSECLFRCETVPHFNMDEAYEINLETFSKGYGVVHANSSWGFIRALESLSQLIFKTDGGIDEFGLQPVIIHDEPRFKHRGYMLDTSRHYISMHKIKQLIDAMAINKLNVFHWHLVDDQSFPYESVNFPELSKNSAYGPDMVYSPRDVISVVEYAALRGIRVMPELDSPGHTYALRSIPGLLTRCYNKTSGEPNGDLGPVNPTRLGSYSAIYRLFGEFKQLFPDEMFHAGGDEVDFDCWDSNPQIIDWMNKNNITNFQSLNNHYMRRIYDLLTLHNRNMIVWQEVFDNGAKMPFDTVIHVWKYINDRPAYMAELISVLNSGYKAILSSCWYLNYIDYGQDWIKYYLCDPTASPVSEKVAQNVLGGEICMWTEFVDDSNVMTRSWPRASAAAERLWSRRDTNNVQDFMSRLEQMRCRMKYRGLDVEPVSGPGYC